MLVRVRLCGEGFERGVWGLEMLAADAIVAVVVLAVDGMLVGADAIIGDGDGDVFVVAVLGGSAGVDMLASGLPLDASVSADMAVSSGGGGGGGGVVVVVVAIDGAPSTVVLAAAFAAFLASLSSLLCSFLDILEVSFEASSSAASSLACAAKEAATSWAMASLASKFKPSYMVSSSTKSGAWLDSIK